MSNSMLGLVRLVTRSAKARIGQIGDVIRLDRSRAGWSRPGPGA